MKAVDWALALGAAGFNVFPLELSKKKPRWNGWQEDASRDPVRIRSSFARDSNVGVGISCDRWGDPGLGYYLFVVDVDLKRGDEPARWLAGATGSGLLPPTYTQFTPSGGLHLFYLSRIPVRSSHSEVAPGVDIHGSGYLAVGAGTVTPAGAYQADLSVAPVEAPEQLIEICGRKKLRPVGEIVPVAPSAPVRVEAALARGLAYVQALPVAGDGARNDHAYKAACHLRQLGLPHAEVFETLIVAFQSDPPMEAEELWDVTLKCFRYAQGGYGALAPEVIFHAPPPAEKVAAEVVPSTGAQTPVEIFNQRYALVLTGGSVRIYDEMPDPDGYPQPPMDLTAFRAFNLNMRFTDGNGDSQEMAQFWLASPQRRTYDGVIFHPGPGPAPARFYNVWRGFSTNGYNEEPTQRAHDAVGELIQCSLLDFCDNDKKLHRIHMAFYAHMVQFPWIKPHICHVYRGKKGVGKDTFVDAMGLLCPAHYMNTPKKRDLAGNFNAHLERLLLFVANEAFWSNDVEIHGILQDLVTGGRLGLERKGCEQYRVKNLIRVVIMGNSDKLVKSSPDERRYAIFDVGERLRGQWRRFAAIRAGMAEGGTKLLYDYLNAFDLTDTNMNEIPNTKGLLEHKRDNLDPVHSWIYESIQAGRILTGQGHAITWQTWPVGPIDREPFRNACVAWCRDQGTLKYAPTSHYFGRRLTECLGDCDTSRRWDGKAQHPRYQLPPLEEASKRFDIFLGGGKVDAKRIEGDAEEGTV